MVAAQNMVQTSLGTVNSTKVEKVETTIKPMSNLYEKMHMLIPL